MPLPVRHLVVFTATVLAGVTLGPAENAESTGDARVLIVPRASRDPHAENSRAIRLDVKVVQIPVTVTDPLDRPIADLRKDDFHLFENDVQQQIVYLSTEEAPASVGLIFDASGSMRNKSRPRLPRSNSSLTPLCQATSSCWCASAPGPTR